MKLYYTITQERKRSLLKILAFTIFLLMPSKGSLAGQDSFSLREPSGEKNFCGKIISKALNCAQTRSEELNSIDYNDICSTEDPSQARYSLAVEKALDRAQKDIDKETIPKEEELSKEQGNSTDLALERTYLISKEELKEENAETDRVQTPVLPEPADHRNSLNHFEFSTYVSSIEYKEPDLMRERGIMYGIEGSYIHRMSENKKFTSADEIVEDPEKTNVFRVDGTFGWGYVDYDSESTGSIDDIRDFMFETRGLAGYDFHPTKSIRLTPYIGIGFRYLNDDSGGRTSTTNHSGYERESHYYYISFRLEALKNLPQDWALGASIEYDYLLAGYQKSHLEDVNVNYNTIENEQKTGYGIRGSARVVKYTRHFDFFFEPFVRFWSIEDSETEPVTYAGTVVGYGYEPENHSLEGGIKIGARY